MGTKTNVEPIYHYLDGGSYSRTYTGAFPICLGAWRGVPAGLVCYLLPFKIAWDMRGAQALGGHRR